MPVALVVLCPLMYGVVHNFALMFVEVLVGATMIGLALTARDERMRVSGVFWLLFAGIFVTLAQVIPLPQSVLKVVSPTIVEWYDYTLGNVGLYDETTWRPLTASAPGTWRALGIAAIAASAFLMYSHMFARRIHGRLPLYLLLGFGALSFLIGLVQSVFHVNAVLGVVSAVQPEGGALTATFVNPNHQGGFFGMAGFTALGLFLSRMYSTRVRMLFLVAAVACFLGQFLSFSRAAISLFLPMVLLFFVLRLRRDGRAASASLLGGAVAGVVAAVGLAGYLAYATIKREIETLNVDTPWQGEFKVGLWGDALNAIKDSPWVGFGRGAYHAMFSRYASVATFETVAFVENEPLQVLVDWGLPFGLLFLLGFAGVFFVAAWRGARDGAAAGAATAFTYIALQNVADFNLEFPGTMVPALMLLAFVVDEHGQPSVLPTRVPNFVVGLLGVMCIVGAVATFVVRPMQLENTRPKVEAYANDDRRTIEEVLEVAKEAVRANPLDFSVYTMVAEYAFLRPEYPNLHRRALNWINAAVYSYPQQSRIHVLAARWAYSNGRTTLAMSEYETAFNLGSYDQVLNDLWSLTRSPEPIVAIAGGTRDGAIAAAQFLRAREMLVDAAEVLTALLIERPDDLEAMKLLAQTQWGIGNDDEVLRVARAALAVDASLGWPYAEIFRVYDKLGRDAEATAVIDEGFAKSSDITDLVVSRATIAYREKDVATIDSLLDRSVRTRKVLSRLYTLKGRLLAEQGNFDEARNAYDAAMTNDPGKPKYRMELAKMLLGAGRLRGAEREYELVLEKHPDHVEAKRALARLRDELDQRLKRSEPKARQHTGKRVLAEDAAEREAEGDVDAADRRADDGFTKEAVEEALKNSRGEKGAKGSRGAKRSRDGSAGGLFDDADSDLME